MANKLACPSEFLSFWYLHAPHGGEAIIDVSRVLTQPAGLSRVQFCAGARVESWSARAIIFFLDRAVSAYCCLSFSFIGAARMQAQKALSALARQGFLDLFRH
jgi:hypothetical protein